MARVVGCWGISAAALFICLFGASGLSCGPRELCCVTWALSPWCTDSIVVERWLIVVTHRLSCSTECGNLSSPTRDRTGVPCVVGWFLNHWNTREVPGSALFVLDTPGCVTNDLQTRQLKTGNVEELGMWEWLRVSHNVVVKR